MAVGWQKPFQGPAPFFGYPQADDGSGMPAPQMPMPGGVGSPMTQDATQPIFAPQDMQKGGMFGSTPSDAKKPDAPAEQDWPSADSIERRRRLAEAMMGRQMEVNHPMQAVANAVSQIAGAYVQNKAEKDEAELQRRRRDFFLGALKDGGTFEGMMTKAMTSPDPALQDMAVKYQLSALEARGKRKGQAPDDVELKYSDGTAQRAYWDDESGDWVTYGDRYPRWQSSGGGGGGSGGGGGAGGGNEKTQKGDWIYVDGKRVFTEFVPGRGMMMRDSQGKLVTIPEDAVSEGSMLSPAAFRKEITTFVQADTALVQMNKYFESVKGANIGLRRWSDTISSHVKTLLSSGAVPARYTPEELRLMEAKGQLQGLLGLFREDVVGGGVMTEYDALRILQRLGGDVTALQNPAVVEPLLRELYESKKRTRDISKRVLDYNSSQYPGFQIPEAQAPDQLGGAAAQAQSPIPGSQGGGQYKPVPRDQLRDGQVYTMKDGRPARWDASKQKFFPVR